MKGCLNVACENTWVVSELSEDQFCGQCGHEMLPHPLCACGREVNLKLMVDAVKRGWRRHCEGCGQRWTELRLSAVMADSLRDDLAKLTPHRFEVN